MIDFQADLIKRFLEETRYIDIKNTHILNISMYKMDIQCTLCKENKEDGTKDFNTITFPYLDLLGWTLRTIETKLNKIEYETQSR